MSRFLNGNKLLFGSLVLFLASCVSFAAYQVAVAAPAPPLNEGFFHGQYSTASDASPNGGRVLVNGIPTSVIPLSATDTTARRQAFVDYVKSCLNSSTIADGCTGPQNRVGAQFIIQTARGIDGDFDRTLPSPADVADFENRVINFPGTIDWGRASYSYTVNSWYQNPAVTGEHDDAFHDDPGVFSAIGYIVFRYNGEDVYVVKRSCANPIGTNVNKYGLPIPNWDTDSRLSIYRADADNNPIGGMITSDVTDAQPGERYVFRYRVRNLGPGETLSTTTIQRDYDYPTSSSGGYITIGTRAAGVAAGTNIYGTQNVGATNTIPTSALGGQYCMRLRHSPNSSSSTLWEYSERLCIRVPYNYGLTPSTFFDTGTGTYTDVGTSTVSFRNRIVNGGTTRSEPADVRLWTNYVLPDETNPANWGSVQNNINNCSPTLAVTTASGGSRCFTEVNSAHTEQFLGPSSDTSLGANSTHTIDISNTSMYPIGTKVCVVLSVSPFSHTDAGTRFGSVRCTRVVAKPFMSVVGGDVSAGGAYCPGGPSIGAVSDAGVFAWNQNSGGYDGGGTSYAAFALGFIHGFATSQATSAGPRTLAFANSSSPSDDRYGGIFGQLNCIHSHYGSLPGGSSSIPNPNFIGSAGSGVFTSTGGTINNPTQINKGQQKIVYISDDLYITRNIIYQGRGSSGGLAWNTASDIPGLKVIVNGDIYIDPAVTELNGIYVAQPPSGDLSKGRIYTCATGMGSPREDYADCNSPLVVNGALIARKVYLLRTNGTLSDDQPAERINYLPELWLARWPDDNSTNSSGYDAITGLPPVL